MSESLYLHVPFCDTICAYCDFERCKSHPLLMEKWAEACIQDLSLCQDHLKTCYIGGGTPSALPCSILEKILKALEPLCQQVEEFSVEVNIENLTLEKCELLKKYHVNRISLGIQSLQENLIQLIERHHTIQDVDECLNRIYTAGIHNISVDLIYGLPTQTLKQWEQDLIWVASHPLISHVSIYSLTIEENSKFGRSHVQPIDSDLEADMYEKAIQILKEHNFEHYEISNFAKKGKESLHNQAYWQYHDFTGVGCGAYGLENHIYYHIPFRLNEYIECSLKREEELKTLEDEMFECIMMGLRMRKGISLNDFKNRFDVDLLDVYAAPIQENIDKNYLQIEKGYLCCSDKGFSLLNEVLISFMNE